MRPSNLAAYLSVPVLAVTIAACGATNTAAPVIALAPTFSSEVLVAEEYDFFAVQEYRAARLVRFIEGVDLTIRANSVYLWQEDDLFYQVRTGSPDTQMFCPVVEFDDPEKDPFALLIRYCGVDSNGDGFFDSGWGGFGDVGSARFGAGYMEATPGTRPLQGLGYVDVEDPTVVTEELGIVLTYANGVLSLIPAARGNLETPQYYEVSAVPVPDEADLPALVSVGLTRLRVLSREGETIEYQIVSMPPAGSPVFLSASFSNEY